MQPLNINDMVRTATPADDKGAERVYQRQMRRLSRRPINFRRLREALRDGALLTILLRND